MRPFIHPMSVSLIIVTGLLGVPATVMAADSGPSVVANVAINYKSLEFAIVNTEFTPRLTTLDIGVTVASGGFYGTLNYDQSIKDAYVYDYTTSSPGGGTGDDTVMAVSRDDLRLTLGYSITPAIVLFGGYMEGTTDVFRIGNYGAISSPDPTEREPDRFNGEGSITMNGPFLGIGYTVSAGSKGALSFSLAYADMGGEFFYNEGANRMRVDGETTGFSYGINWTGPMGDNASYNIGLRSNRYKFKVTETLTTTDNFDHDQNYTMFVVGVSRYF